MLVCSSVQVQAYAALVRYVGLGDSFSSGEGTFNYYSSSNNCHRAYDGYVNYVASKKSLGTPKLAACSGATTADMYVPDSSSSEPPQLLSITGSTELVTLTIGGNDIGFADVVQRCAHYPGHNGWGCSKDSSLTTAVNNRMAALAGTKSANAPDGQPISNLTWLLYDLGSYVSHPNAKIFVGGYPRLFGGSRNYYSVNGSAPSGNACQLTLAANIDYNDAQWMNLKANQLNSIIQSAINSARSAGYPVYYVPPALFSGHELCSSYEPWINPVFLSEPPGFPVPLPESLHPTVQGQKYGYGNAFISVINKS